MNKNEMKDNQSFLFEFFFAIFFYNPTMENKNQYAVKNDDLIKMTTFFVVVVVVALIAPDNLKDVC